MSDLDEIKRALAAVAAGGHAPRECRQYLDVRAPRWLAELVERVERAEALNRGMICAWCGATFERLADGDPPHELVDHALACAEHPLLKRAEAAEARAAELEGELEAHKESLELAQVESDGYGRGRHDERAAIVAWLGVEYATGQEASPGWYADQITAGAHHASPHTLGPGRADGERADDAVATPPASSTQAGESPAGPALPSCYRGGLVAAAAVGDGHATEDSELHEFRVAAAAFEHAQICEVSAKSCDECRAAPTPMRLASWLLRVVDRCERIEAALATMQAERDLARAEAKPLRTCINNPMVCATCDGNCDARRGRG